MSCPQGAVIRLTFYSNPVTYCDETGAGISTCACGCGETVPANRSFAPGHDQKAIHQRITRQWGGTIGFIEWFDATYPQESSAA